MANNTKDKKDNVVLNAGLGATCTKVVTRYGSGAAEYIRGYSGEITSNRRLVKGLWHIAQYKAEH